MSPESSRVSGKWHSIRESVLFWRGNFCDTLMVINNCKLKEARAECLVSLAATCTKGKSLNFASTSESAKGTPRHKCWGCSSSSLW